MKTIHIHGWAQDIDLASKLSDQYGLDWSFPFDEDGVDEIELVFLRFYESDKECTLDEAVEGWVEKMVGKLTAVGSDYGYSEYTIEGFNISSLKLGGHDLKKIFESKKGKYLHILIDQIKK